MNLFCKHIWKKESEYYNPSAFELLQEKKIENLKSFKADIELFINYTTVIYRCVCGKIKEKKYKGKITNQ